MTLSLPLLYVLWLEEYCQISPNKNLWHITSILVCCIFAYGSWEFFFLCSPDCPKQPRTSFPFYKFFYTTISAKISVCNRSSSGSDWDICQYSMLQRGCVVFWKGFQLKKSYQMLIFLFYFQRFIIEIERGIIIWVLLSFWSVQQIDISK